MTIELVVFDGDGVLVDSERLANQVLAELLTEIGLPTTTDASIATYMGLSMTSVVTPVEAHDGAPLTALHFTRTRNDQGATPESQPDRRNVICVLEVIPTLRMSGWSR